MCRRPQKMIFSIRILILNSRKTRDNRPLVSTRYLTILEIIGNTLNRHCDKTMEDPRKTSLYRRNFRAMIARNRTAFIRREIVRLVKVRFSNSRCYTSSPFNIEFCRRSAIIVNKSITFRPGIPRNLIALS